MSFPWMDIARTYIGLSELPGSDDNPKILEMFRLCGHAKVTDDETAWCAAYLGACLALAGFKGTGSLLARSYEQFGEPLKTPAEGCVAVFWRNSKKSGEGHVAFFLRETKKGIEVLGGNQSGRVSIATYPREQLLGYVVPAQTAALPESFLPTILRVNPANAPAHLKGAAPLEGLPVTMPQPELTMAQGSDQFLLVHPNIEKWEGGYVDHPQDPGGATNMGITLATLRAWRGTDVSKQDVKNLSKSEAREIFRARYYGPVGGDQLPAPVALAVYNSAVLSGVGRASSWLQTALRNMGQSVDVDGEVGPQTLGAVARVNAGQLAAAYFNTYEQFLRGLSTFAHFGKGWMNRLNDMRQVAQTLPQTVAVPPTDAPQTIPPKDLLQVLLAVLAAVSAAKQGGQGKVAQGDILAILLKALGSEAPAPQTATELTPVNGALGETIGKALDGRKTGLGIVGLLATTLLPALAPDFAANLGMGSGSGGTVWTSIFAALAGWGVLGKADKWVKEVKK